MLPHRKEQACTTMTEEEKKKRSTFTDEGDGNGRQVNHGQYTNRALQIPTVGAHFCSSSL